MAAATDLANQRILCNGLVAVRLLRKHRNKVRKTVLARRRKGETFYLDGKEL